MPAHVVAVQQSRVAALLRLQRGVLQPGLRHGPAMSIEALAAEATKLSGAVGASFAEAMEAIQRVADRAAVDVQRLTEALCVHDRTTTSHGLTIRWATCPRCR